MTLTQLLFLLRLLSAAILIAFLITLAYFMFREMQTAVQPKSAAVYGRLHITQQNSQTTLPLQPVTSIGRADDNQIILKDGCASHHHARLCLQDGRWWLEDLGSRNGSLLNEIPLTETAVISDGDIISIGSAHIRVEITDGVAELGMPADAVFE